jgi:peptidoglycan/LPS O-acetylase OafA/YrhL
VRILVEQDDKGSTIRIDLQYLRAFAILSVVAYHANADFFKIGFIGVDFFFCISGFVLAPKFLSITETRDIGLAYKALKLFIRGRIYRLYPAMLLCILVSTPLIALTLPTGKYLERALSQAEYSLFSLANFSANTLAGDYFNPAPNPFLHLWSLGAEWQLYIFFALLGCVMAFFRFRHPQSKFLGFSLVLSFASVIFFVLSTSEDTFSYYNPFLRLWEFGIGILAYFLCRRFPKVHSRTAMYFFLSILLLVVLLPLKNSLSHVETVILLLLFIPFTIFSESGIQGNRFILWVASRSYSIYLYHWVFFVIVKHSTLNFFEQQNSKVFLTVAALVLTLICADFSYRYFEKPTARRVIIKKRSFFVLVISVVALLMPLDIANARGFWGFNDLNSQPRFAGDDDPGCDRTLITDKPCTYGRFENAPALNLVGDSHAAALSNALVAVGAQLRLNVNVWSLKGCKYVDPSVLSQSNSDLYSNPIDPCFRRDSAFRKYLASHPGDIVFGAWRSQDCRSNEFFGLCGIPFVNLQLNSFNALASTGNKVVVFTPVPEFRDLKFFAPRSLVQTKYHASSFELKENMVTQSFLDGKHMNAHPGALSLISSENVLCDPIFCTRKLGDRWLYRDTNHLSIEGANLFIPRIIQVLQSR